MHPLLHQQLLGIQEMLRRHQRRAKCPALDRGRRHKLTDRLLEALRQHIRDHVRQSALGCGHGGWLVRRPHGLRQLRGLDGLLWQILLLVLRWREELLWHQELLWLLELNGRLHNRLLHLWLLLLGWH